MKQSLAFVLVAGSAVFAGAQVSNNTSLVGTVTDQSGSVVAGATVVGTNTATGVQYTGKTNEEGYYQIPFVQPGTYQIQIQSAGFEQTTVKGVIVTLNLAVRTDAKMRVGSAQDSVTVTAETPALSTDDALVGETLTSKQVENLPIAGRRVLELASTNPSIIVGPKTSYTGNPPGANYIGAGTREVTNSLTLDGITIMNSLISNSSVTPNADAVGAVQTQTGNYTAQYGAYMGVHINVDTKSGGNTFHGTAFDYVQNTAFNAKGFLAGPGTRTPVLHFNQFGFVLDGPVTIPKLFSGRDRLFFMGSYEGIRQKSQTTTIATLITPAMAQGDFSAILSRVQLVNPVTKVPFAGNRGLPVSPFATKLLQYYATPNQTGATNNINSNVPNSFSQDQTLDRVDYALNEKVRFFARYDYQTIYAVNGNVVPTSGSASPTKNSNGLFAYTHIITPHLINDFRIGFNKFSSNQLNYFYLNGLNSAGTDLGIPGFTADTANNNPGIPTITFNSTYTGLGAEGTNWFQDDRAIHGYDQISYQLGKHNIMAGADIRRMTIGRAAQGTPRGQFAFNGAYTGDPAADFITGYSNQVTTPVFQFKSSVAEWRNGFFLQDTWQASQKLTVQYGVRYELPLVPYSLNGFARILNTSYTALTPNSTATSPATFVPQPGFHFHGPNHDLVSPRLGLSYRATDKIVVRGGGGIYYNPNHLNAFTLASSNYPLAASVVFNGNTGANAVGTLTFANPTGGATGAAPVAGVPGTYVSAFTDNYYLPTPRLYQWNLDTGVELWPGGALELQYLGSKAVDLDRSYYPNQPTPGPGSVNPRRPYQLFGQIRQINNDSFSTYHGLSSIYRQRTIKGLDVMLGYTWAHSMDTSNDANGGGTAMIQNNLRADYGNSNWDIRNRFVGTVTYAMPDFRRWGAVGNSLLGGWHANTIVTLQSGIPFNVSISPDLANVGGIGTQRPNYVHAPRTTCSRFTRISGNASCIDSTAYTLPAQYTFGNTHRNDAKGPGFANMDFSLFKDFALYERLKLQLRAESFNLLNHSNVGNPGNVTLGSATFGQISTMATGYTPRKLQFAAKINF